MLESVVPNQVGQQSYGLLSILSSFTLGSLIWAVYDVWDGVRLPSIF